ncbi:MAG: GNAT family N-acetyltransferase [Acidobacteriota bacterium]|nr:GNAT family N-acetyltransferase [Acidobacteriota bacterium]
MAVLDRLRGFWQTFVFERPKPGPEISFTAPLPPDSLTKFSGEYQIRPLTIKQLDELDALDCRCFTNGDSYTRHTLEFLLKESNSLAYCVVLPKTGQMTAFVIAMHEPDGTGHITTIGVAPEHRRRGLAFLLLEHVENAFRLRNVRTMRLEVRTNNFGAQQLYARAGYTVAQRMNNYYANGGDGFLMVKSLV